jgi:hypothetical protein
MDWELIMGIKTRKGDELEDVRNMLPQRRIQVLFLHPHPA